MYCGLKSAIMILLLVSGVLALVAMVTDYWLAIPSLSHVGLYRICTNDGCSSLYNTEHVQNILLSIFFIGLLFIWPCSILEVRYARAGAYGCLMYMGALSCLMVILGIAAMVQGPILLSEVLNQAYPLYRYSWSYAVGWISVIAAAASAALSFYVSRVEPPTPAPEGGDETGTQTGVRPTGQMAIHFNRISKVFSH